MWLFVRTSSQHVVFFAYRVLDCACYTLVSVGVRVDIDVGWNYIITIIFINHDTKPGCIGIPFLKVIFWVLSFVEMERKGRECLAKTC
jgi:hypothetical protein